MVRKSLENFLKLNGGVNDFADREMGCAQETLDSILGYLHREFLHQNYLEEYVEMTKD